MSQNTPTGGGRGTNRNPRTGQVHIHGQAVNNKRKQHAKIQKEIKQVVQQNQLFHCPVCYKVSSKDWEEEIGHCPYCYGRFKDSSEIYEGRITKGFNRYEIDKILKLFEFNDSCSKIATKMQIEDRECYVLLSEDQEYGLFQIYDRDPILSTSKRTIDVKAINDVDDEDLKEIHRYINNYVVQRCYVCGQFTGFAEHKCPNKINKWNESVTATYYSDSIRTITIDSNLEQLYEFIDQTDDSIVIDVLLKNRENTQEKHARYIVIKQNEEIVITPFDYNNRYEANLAEALETYINNNRTIKKSSRELIESFENKSMSSTQYSSNIDKFVQIYNSNQPIPYIIDDATDNIGSRRFGLELEVSGDIDINGLISDLSEYNLIDPNYTYFMDYHTGKTSNKYWRVEKDETVKAEIISPICSDTPNTWHELEKICDIIKKRGGVATTKCGGHVHVSTDDYKNNTTAYLQLLNIVKAYEDELFSLAHNPEHIAHRGFYFCSPNKIDINNQYQNAQNIRERYASHYSAINFSNMQGGNEDHVEFRLWDGSLDPAIIQTQVKLSLGLTNYGMCQSSNGDFLPHTELGTHYKQKNNIEQDTDGFRQFVDQIFCRDIDKEQATLLFAKTRWQNDKSYNHKDDSYDDWDES